MNAAAIDPSKMIAIILNLDGPIAL